MKKEIALDGVGLHSGAAVRVVLRSCEGPVRIRANGLDARIDELVVASSARATTVEACGGGLRVSTVEHAFAALAGLGVYEGVVLSVEGPEMPLLDGGSMAWCEAIAALELTPRAPRLRIARETVIEVGASRFELSPNDGAIDVEVRLEVNDPRLEPSARWHGDSGDFRRRIAPARTFAMARDVTELARAGLARHVDPTSVVLIAQDAIHCALRPFSSDEPARHKLLDLIGDLYLRGGPPLGRVRAVRPGHAANALAFRLASERGAFATT